jgi:polyisoprenoid-binding protein YceI
MRTAFLALFVLWSLPAAATTWSIDPNHSGAHFSARHMMISKVRGDFSKVAGTVQVDDRDVSKLTVEASIDAATINTRVPGRDEHLRSADFFDVAKFPTIAFVSTEVRNKGGASFDVSGNLTMHGITRPVVLQVELTPEAKDPNGSLRRGAEALTKIKRKDFGLTWNKTLEGGGVLIGDDVEVTIDLELVRKGPKEARAK